MVTIYFYNHGDGLDHSRLTKRRGWLKQNSGCTATYLFRRSGFKANYDKLMALKAADGNHEVYTDDETMLKFAEWDPDNKNFRVHLETKGSCFFWPLYMLIPHVSRLANLTTMQQKGLLDGPITFNRKEGE